MPVFTRDLRRLRQFLFSLSVPRKSLSFLQIVDTKWTPSRSRTADFIELPAVAKFTLCETRSLTFVVVLVLRSAEFLGESDEKPFRSAYVAKPIRIFIPDYFAY